MDNDSSMCGICGRVWVANEPHYCTMGVPKDMDSIMRELKEAAENWKASDGFINVITSTPVVSDLELKIRKEVMVLIKEFEVILDYCYDYRDYYGEGCGYAHERTSKFNQIKDRLNLLWGE